MLAPSKRWVLNSAAGPHASFFCQLREIVVPQERLLAAEDIEIPRGVILEVLLELPQGIVRLPGLFFCHQFPPRMTMVPISSVR